MRNKHLSIRLQVGKDRDLDQSADADAADDPNIYRCVSDRVGPVLTLDIEAQPE
jgi:hypothetical protein